jgi:SAM-dependent methyltransferase
MMGNWYDYRCSDFDFNGHRGDLALDLQNIDLPNATVDVLLTPHVLEHVPDTEKALSEVHRILAPGGRMYLQVPLLQGVTAPPVTEEYHADNTLVHWRFGWDLTDVLRRTGFAVRVLVPGAFRTILEEGGESLGEGGGGFDPASIRAAAVTTDLDAVLTPSEARHLGVEPPHQYVVWECERRAGPT